MLRIGKSAKEQAEAEQMRQAVAKLRRADHALPAGRRSWSRDAGGAGADAGADTQQGGSDRTARADADGARMISLP
jgi:hypothetical protein